MTNDAKTKEANTGESSDSLMARARAITKTPVSPNSSRHIASGSVADTIHEFNQNVSLIRRYASATRVVLGGLWTNVIEPIWNFFRPPALWIWRHYLSFWRRWACSTIPGTNERVLSRTRSSAVLVATFLLLSIFTNTRIGSAVRFVTVEPIADAILIGLSKRVEVFYLTQSDEIDPDNNIHSVRGCRKRGECAEVDAAYFRVQPRLAHDVWKLLTYGNPVYVPDHIVAPIAPGLNECHVTYYGYRMTSSWIARILRSLQFYPTMLEAKCTYLGGQT